MVASRPAARRRVRLPRPSRWCGAILGLLLAAWCHAAGAHPLGNFAVSRYARLDFAAERVAIAYILDFAEVPTYQLRDQLDPNGDGDLDPAEADAYLDAAVPALIAGQRLSIAGETVPLAALERSAVFITGPAGLPTLRVVVRFGAPLPTGWRQDGRVAYRDDNYRDRIGWREILARGDAGIAVSGITGDDLTDELQVYPQDMLDTPLALSEVAFTIAPADGGGTAAQAAGRVNTREGQRGGPTGQVAALLRLDRPSPALLLASLALAAFWGAAHALSPGHGKAVVAAYLVGARGTPRHAVFLGLTVTLTHTAGVFALGGITLWLARFLLPERLYPWLNVASGLLVLAIGFTLIAQRLGLTAGGAGHAHGHREHGAHPQSHPHPHAHRPVQSAGGGGRVTWRGLLALGVSGGLVPCPSALVLLLSAVAVGRIGYGLLLVLAFSAGLALVLTAIGLLCVYARRLFARLSFEPRLPAFLPLLSACAIAGAGVLILVDALRSAGLV